MRHMLRTAHAALTLATVVLLAPTATAQQPAQNVRDGVALHGYDAVAYQTEQRPVQGSAAYTAIHEGVTYRFASAANRDRFAAAPATYAPAYGGYCAFGVAAGGKYDIDPAAFSVVNGTLYLNKNRSVQRTWREDVPGNIKKADRNWPTVRTR